MDVFVEKSTLGTPEVETGWGLGVGGQVDSYMTREGYQTRRERIVTDAYTTYINVSTGTHFRSVTWYLNFHKLTGDSVPLWRVGTSPNHIDSTELRPYYSTLIHTIFSLRSGEKE